MQLRGEVVGHDDHTACPAHAGPLPRRSSSGGARAASVAVMTAATVTGTSFGSLLRDWRQRRRLTQLDLGIQADVSARHLSFLETGRSRPSREMVLLLAEELDVPLRARNELMTAAGFAPAYTEHHLDDAELTEVRASLRRILTGHEPYPALLVDG